MEIKHLNLIRFWEIKCARELRFHKITKIKLVKFRIKLKRVSSKNVMIFFFFFKNMKFKSIRV